MDEQNEVTEYQLPYTLTLRDPIDVFKDGEVDHLVKELVITRKVQARDLQNVKMVGGDDSMTIADVIVILSNLTGQPVKVLEQMSVPDTMQAVEVMSSFLGLEPQGS